MKTILIILITSLFWAMGIYIDRNYSDVIKAEIREWVNEEIVEEVKEEVADVKEDIAEAKAMVTPRKSSTTAPKPQPKTQPKATQPKTLEKNYAELICGYWVPVEGNTLQLEITKYGTVIQWDFHYDKSKYERRREQYTISGNKLNIGSYYKCSVEVIKENGTTYLEVYGHEYFAGKYRKR